MPPKAKVNKQDIINAALNIVKTNGVEAVNARSLASTLGCSTQPIFSNFKSMEELEEAAIFAAYQIYLGFLKAETESDKYPKYKAFGMAYIRFAREEKELFKLLFMRNRTSEDLSPSPDFNESVELIAKSHNINKEKATLMHLEMWVFVHGIGTMLATSFLPLDEEAISKMISDVYQGIRSRLLAEEK
ncbi:MAG: TetR/AcrR family transcriptional regulator [Clostridia bacterium]|nr:TetR/AcrR family transcriptional regulator [Clostridia bacterium]